MKMRKISLSAFWAAAILTVPLTGRAEPAGGTKCVPPTIKEYSFSVTIEGKVTPSSRLELVDPGVTSNCWLDDVFVVSGDEKLGGKPLVYCSQANLKPGAEKPKDCALIDGETQDTETDPVTKVVTVTPRSDYGRSNMEAAAQRVAARALALMKEKGGQVPAKFWDEVVVLTADFKKDKDPDGPLFFRQREADEGTSPYINETTNIGIKDKGKRSATRPYTGVILAGSSDQATTSTGAFSPCGKTPRRPTDPQVTSPNITLCAPGIASYFDALAQATANIYGPYLETDPRWIASGETGQSVATGWGLSSWPALKSNVLTAASGAAKVTSSPLRVWNAFLSMDGSILGGGAWRDAGNDTYEAGRPPPFYGIAPGRNGGQILRFHPLDLYLMGFMPDTASELAIPIQSFTNATKSNIHRPLGLSGFEPAWISPTMGMRLSGAAIRKTSGVPFLLSPKDIIDYNSAEGMPKGRQPAYAKAAHHISQFWVAVTRPIESIKAEVAQAVNANKNKLPELKKKGGTLELYETDRNVSVARGQWNAIVAIAQRRRQFAEYFYSLTGWRGRVITTAEADVDDMAYWEFGWPEDDKKTFAVAGFEASTPPLDAVNQAPADLTFPGRQAVANSQDISTALWLSSTGGGTITYKGFPNAADKVIPIRISGFQGEAVIKTEGDAKTTTLASRTAANNIITLRMRLRKPGNDAVQAKTKIFAMVSLSGKPCSIEDWRPLGDQPEMCLRIPSNDKAFLIADGKWRNYAANIGFLDAFTGITRDRTPDKVTKVALSLVKPAINIGEPQTVTSVIVTPTTAGYSDGSPAEIDVESIRVGNSGSPGDNDLDCNKLSKPDGYLDSEDNCKDLYNPDQADGDQNGVGDACEDYDGDQIPNLCDNCPTLTNSRQRDKDKDGKGDICDEGTGAGCVFQPDSLAGVTPVNARAPLALAAAVVGALGLMLGLKRRRRK